MRALYLLLWELAYLIGSSASAAAPTADGKKWLFHFGMVMIDIHRE
jgi:hypothetical protein